MDTRFTLMLASPSAFLARYELRQRAWLLADLHEYEVETPFLPQEETDLALPGKQLVSRIRGDYPDGLTCRMVIPANWCLAHHVELPANRWSEQAAEFEFEQHIPVDLESLTCASSRIGSGEALVIAVFTDALRGLLRALEESLIFVELVTVDATLVGSDNEPRRTDGFRAVAIVDDRRVTLATIGGQPRTLRGLWTVGVPPADISERLPRHTMIAASFLQGPCSHWHVLPLSQTSASHDIVRVVESAGDAVEIETQSEAVEHILGAAASCEDPVDLRKCKLAYAGRWTPVRARIKWCVVALAVLLVVLAVRLRLDNITYADAVGQLRPLPGQIYKTVFSGAPIPPGAALHLRSERLKLEGLTEKARAGAGDLRPSGLEAFELLHQVTARIPVNLRLCVNEVLLDDQGMRLAGQTTTHAAAGKLVQELNRIPTIAVDPPRTKLRKDRTVDFHIRAKRIIDEASE